MDDEILHEFLLESRESLDLLDRELIALETNPRDPARLASIFRSVHTIKGTAGFFQFRQLEAISHVGENLLSRLRDGTIVLEAVRTSALLAMVDALRALLLQIETSEVEGEGRYEPLIELIMLVCEDQNLAKAADKLAQQVRCVSSHPPPRAPAGAPQAMPPVQGATLPRPEAQGAPIVHAADPRIRVDVGLLDQLMNLVGELVLTRNQLLQHVSGSAESFLVSTCQHLNLITTELQEGVMKTRMQPIENVWNRLPRMVRELAQSCGKQVRLELEGGSTELDRAIVEAIGDPLTHLVRNSIDHGIESPAARTAAHKPASGTLRLRSYHEGGRVNIELSDDGNGIDCPRVIERAIARGLVTLERAAKLSKQDVYALLFLPGFSTAEAVTNISGRGVGLDVVKSNIERLGGTVDVDSQEGHGTSFRIRIPLTLAIIPALLVGSAHERFAIPQASLVELVRIDEAEVPTAIERLHGVPFYRLRGNLLPLVELGALLELEHESALRDRNLVVLQADERQFGLLVDHIFDTEEIVVKPLGRELKGLITYSGATIMGDGRVALILDVAGLAERAGVGASERRLAGEQRRASVPTGSPEKHEQLLLFRTGKTARMAIPLRDVTRLEEFSRARVEHVGGEDFVQYRGSILPLIYLSELFGELRGDGDMLQVLVHSAAERDVGFVVESIEDVIHQQWSASRTGGRRGTLGSSVIRGKVTEILDAHVARERAGS
jgi:two-component system chemotaxis sensor kinase CheA